MNLILDLTEADGRPIRLEAKIWGDPQRQPSVLLLHEGLGSVALWRDFPEKISQSLNVAVVAYSRTGYGRSSPLAQIPRPVDYLSREADLVPHVLDQLGLKQVWILGHSDGGSIGLLAASRYWGRILGATLLAPHSFVEDMCLSAIAAVGPLYETSLKERMAKYHDHPDHAFYGWHDTWLSPEFKALDLIGEAKTCQTRLWVVQGRQDEYATLAQVSALTDANPLIRAEVLEQCRHSPHFDQPDQVLRILKAGLATLGQEI